MITVIAKIINLLIRLKIPLPAKAVTPIERYLWNRPERIRYFLCAINPAALWKIAEIKLIPLVNRAIKNTPALKNVQMKFFPAQSINNLAKFKKLFPILDKENYIKKNSLPDLCQGGVLPKRGSFYKSAGTSGKPTLWVESLEEEMAFDKAVSFISSSMLDMFSKNYIVFNCWALGSWPTGVNFAVAARFHGKTLNVGTNLEETLMALETLGPAHPYLLAGYPPFIFNLIKECETRGINLSDYPIDIVTGGEGFIEEWRDTLLKKVGKTRIIFSVYGSTDKGLGEGVETNLAYTIRSLLHIANTILKDEEAARDIMVLRFGAKNLPFSKEAAKLFLLDFLKYEENIARIPMVFQFDPTNYFNENITVTDPNQNREIQEFLTTVLTPEASIPRIRYNIHDEGFVLHHENVAAILAKYNLSASALNPRNDPTLDLHLPFLFIFGRSDGTISLDGANIFPEDIQKCIRVQEELSKIISSFQLFITKDYRLGIAIELNPGIAFSAENQIGLQNHFKNNLAEYSFGYRELAHDRLASANIVVELYNFNDGLFSERTIKMRYVKH